MKKILLAVMLFSILFFSCSKRNVISEAEQISTLKSLSEKKIKEVYWTDQSGSGRLQENISKIPGIASDLRVSPIMVLISQDQNTPIYPVYSDFGSLDISSLPENILSIVENFSKAIISGEDADGFMVKSNLFNLAFFYEDMRGSGRLNFTDYLIGEPFGSGDEYEVPVRLYSSSSKTDIRLFLVQENGAWKIDQIQFK